MVPMFLQFRNYTLTAKPQSEEISDCPGAVGNFRLTFCWRMTTGGHCSPDTTANFGRAATVNNSNRVTSMERWGGNCLRTGITLL